MAIKISDLAVNAMLDALETYAGTSIKLQIWSGTVPADETASTGASVKLVEMTLPSDWAAAAASGVKSKSGTWTGSGLATGVATYFRLTTSGGTPFLQGTLTATGGGGDATIDNVNIAPSQVVTVTSFSLTGGNL